MGVGPERTKKDADLIHASTGIRIHDSRPLRVLLRLGRGGVDPHKAFQFPNGCNAVTNRVLRLWRHRSQGFVSQKGTPEPQCVIFYWTGWRMNQANRRDEVIVSARFQVSYHGPRISSGPRGIWTTCFALGFTFIGLRIIIRIFVLLYVIRDSSVSKATGYGMGDCWLIPGRGKDFCVTISTEALLSGANSFPGGNVTKAW